MPKQMQESNEFTTFFTTLLPQLNKTNLQTLNHLYPDPSTDPASPYIDTRNLSALGLGTQYKRIEATYGQYAYVCPVRQTAQHASRGGQTQPSVYLYHWSLNRTVVGGANHGDQIFYETMSPVVRDVSPTQDEIAKVFSSYITSFILTGDPNTLRGRKAVQRPTWWPFNSVAQQGGDTMVFGRGNDEGAGGSGVGVAAEFVRDRWAVEACGFWWEMAGVSED